MPPRVKDAISAYLTTGPIIAVTALTIFVILATRASGFDISLLLPFLLVSSLSLYSGKVAHQYQTEGGEYPPPLLVTLALSLAGAGAIVAAAIVGQLSGPAHRFLPLTTTIEVGIVFGGLPSLAFFAYILAIGLIHAYKH